MTVSQNYLSKRKAIEVCEGAPQGGAGKRTESQGQGPRFGRLRPLIPNLFLLRFENARGEELAHFSHSRLLCMHERHLDQVFAYEPHLQFIGTQDLADNHVVGAGVL